MFVSEASLAAAVLLTGIWPPVDSLRISVTPEVERIAVCRAKSTKWMRIHTRLTITNLTGTPAVVAHTAVGGDLIRNHA